MGVPGRISQRDSVGQLNHAMILYDADCSICAAQAANLERLARKKVLAKPLQSVTFSDPRLSAAEIRKEIKLVFPNGDSKGGAEAIVQLAIIGRPRLGKLASLYYLPGIRWLADKVYSYVASNRYQLFGRANSGDCVTGACAVTAASRATEETQSQRDRP